MTATTVLCPLDGTPAAERAIPWATYAAERFGLPLTLFSAVEDAHEVGRRVEEMGSHAGAPDCEVEVVVDPHAPSAIAERAGGEALVVMATSTQPLIHHGYLGSAAETVVRRSEQPTLLVGPRSTLAPADTARVVACCDGSRLSELALAPADAWAKKLDAELWIVSVLPPAYETGNAPSITESNYVRRTATCFDAQWDVLHGSDPARSIAAWADRSLLSMTSHGRSGWSRLRLGSVTTATVRWASGPVLVTSGDDR